MDVSHGQPRGAHTRSQPEPTKASGRKASFSPVSDRAAFENPCSQLTRAHPPIHRRHPRATVCYFIRGTPTRAGTAPCQQVLLLMADTAGLSLTAVMRAMLPPQRGASAPMRLGAGTEVLARSKRSKNCWASSVALKHWRSVLCVAGCMTHTATGAALIRHLYSTQTGHQPTSTAARGAPLALHMKQETKTYAHGHINTCIL